MSEMQFDGSVPAEQSEAQAADEASSLEIGEQLSQAENQLLAGKYKSAEDLERGYLELQTKFSEQNPTPQQPEQQQQFEQPSSVGDKLAEAFEAYTNEKQFNAEAFNDVSKEELIKAFFDNSEAPADLSDQQINEVVGRGGGQEQHEQMMRWAASVFPPEEIQQFDQIIDSANVTQINMAVDAVAKRFFDANGQEGTTLTGRQAINNQSYRSQQELIRDMNDPKYENDPAYRNDVMNKLANSPNLEF